MKEREEKNNENLLVFTFFIRRESIHYIDADGKYKQVHLFHLYRKLLCQHTMNKQWKRNLSAIVIDMEGIVVVFGGP